jgi:hypothetical protein
MTVTYTPRPQSLYGRLIAGVDVAQAMRARVDADLDAYLDEVERQHGLTPGHLERPRAFVDDERLPEDQLPALVVKSTGTADLPEATGQGGYRTRFGLELEAHVAAGVGAMQIAQLYALALRALAVQRPSALYMGVDWTGEHYDRGTLVGGRTYCVGVVELEVHVPDVVNRHAGPSDELGWPDVPPRDPESPEWPTSASADVELDKVPLDEPVGED